MCNHTSSQAEPSYPHPLADIFPDSPPSSPRFASPLASYPSEIPGLRATHNTAGYRSGISSSKSASLQTGFDEGYSLGAVLGLRAGYVLGVLEGLCVASRIDINAHGGKVEQGAAHRRTDEMEMKKLLAEAKQELKIEIIFGKEWWGEDGVWKFEVGGIKEVGQMVGEEVTFEQVAENHPLLQKWLYRTGDEMKRLGITEGRFEGEEWESGRTKESDAK